MRVRDQDSEMGKEGSSCKDTSTCWPPLWSVELDPAETIWKILYKLHLRIAISLQPPSYSMDVKTSMRFQDAHPPGLGIPTAIAHPTRGVKAAPGQKGRCRAARQEPRCWLEQKWWKKGGPWDGLVHFLGVWIMLGSSVLAAAKSLQSCLTLCDPIDSSPPGSPIPGILQARTLEWGAISFSNAWKWKGKVKSLSCVRFCATPWSVLAT